LKRNSRGLGTKKSQETRITGGIYHGRAEATTSGFAVQETNGEAHTLDLVRLK